MSCGWYELVGFIHGLCAACVFSTELIGCVDVRSLTFYPYYTCIKAVLLHACVYIYSVITL